MAKAAADRAMSACNMLAEAFDLCMKAAELSPECANACAEAAEEIRQAHICA